MLAEGTPLHVVSEILGHASIAITKDVYGTWSKATGGRLRSQ
jgi:integrase